MIEIHLLGLIDFTAYILYWHLLYTKHYANNSNHYDYSFIQQILIAQILGA